MATKWRQEKGIEDNIEDSFVDVFPSWRDQNESPNVGYTSFICIPDKEEFAMITNVRKRG